MKICKCGICEMDCEYHKTESIVCSALVEVEPNTTYTITIGEGGGGKTTLSRKYFNATGTWTTPEGVTEVIIFTVGGSSK